VNGLRKRSASFRRELDVRLRPENEVVYVVYVGLVLVAYSPSLAIELNNCSAYILRY